VLGTLKTIFMFSDLLKRNLRTQNIVLFKATIYYNEGDKASKRSEG
jgi:hypothetical protein